MADETELHQVERSVARVLLVGVVLSSVVLLLGWILMMASNLNAFADPLRGLDFLGPGVQFPRTIPDVLHGVGRWHGPSYMTLGLILLISTPMLRVLCSFGTFAYQRDRVYSLVTAAVLVLLALSIALGQTH